MPIVTIDGPIALLDMGAGENRFSPSWLTEMHKALDEVEQAERPPVLVTHGTGKFFSNGLDLDWLTAHPDQLGNYVADVQALLARVLGLGVPTAAAINGHAFGAGAMLAMAHDFRLMRADRGYFCFPEVDINIPFTPGMAALIQAKLTPASAVASMTTGRRLDAAGALELGIVDGTADADALVERTANRVRELAGKTPATLAAIKRTMFAGALTALTTPVDKAWMRA